MQPLRDIMEERQYEVREYNASGFQMSTKAKIVLLILGGVFLVVGVIIFAVSWETLEPLEYGLVSIAKYYFIYFIVNLEFLPI